MRQCTLPFPTAKLRNHGDLFGSLLGIGRSATFCYAASLRCKIYNIMSETDASGFIVVQRVLGAPMGEPLMP